MTLSDYQTFVTIAECQSLTLTAEKLHLTKSAVSHAVSRMEEELNFPLFYRTQRAVMLTEAARQLLPHAYTVLRENDRFMEEVHSIQGLTSGCVSIGTCSSTCINWIPDIANTFRERYPHIEIRVRSGASNAQILQWLRNNEIDIGIASATPSPGLDIQEIYRDEMLCVTSKAFTAKNPGYITMEEVKDLPLILQTGPYGEEAVVPLNEWGLNPPVYLTTYDDASLVAMAEGGLGYCVAGKLVLKSLRARVNVYSFHPRKYRCLSRIRNSRNRLSPAVDTMSRHIIQYVKNYPDFELNL